MKCPVCGDNTDVGFRALGNNRFRCNCCYAIIEKRDNMAYSVYGGHERSCIIDAKKDLTNLSFVV